MDRRVVRTRRVVLWFTCWHPPCQLMLVPTSYNSVFIVVESFPWGVHTGGNFMLLCPLPHPPPITLDILIWVVMVDPPSELVSTSITGGGELPHNCAFHGTSSPRFHEEKCLCMFCPSQYELHTPFRWRGPDQDISFDLVLWYIA